MNDDLNKLLEIKQDGEPPAKPGSRVTLFARFSQACSWICVAFALFAFIPGGPTMGGPFDFPVYPLIGYGGLMIFAPLTVLMAIVALLRIWLSSRDLKGVKQVFSSMGIAALTFGIFVMRISLSG